MGLEFELEESDFVGFIEDGRVLEATVVAIRSKEANFIDETTGEKAKRVEFKFLISDPDGVFDGQNIWGETPNKFNSHPECKLRQWTEAILGRDLPVGYMLDTDSLIGQDCRIGVKYREFPDKKATVDPSTGELPKKGRNDVANVFPTEAKAAAIIEAARTSSSIEDEPF